MFNWFKIKKTKEEECVQRYKKIIDEKLRHHAVITDVIINKRQYDYELIINYAYRNMNDYVTWIISDLNDNSELLDNAVEIIDDRAYGEDVYYKYPFMRGCNFMDFEDAHNYLINNIDLKRALLYLKKLEGKEYYKLYEEYIFDRFHYIAGELSLDEPKANVIPSYEKWVNEHNTALIPARLEQSLLEDLKKEVPNYEEILHNLNKRDIAVSENNILVKM